MFQSILLCSIKRINEQRSMSAIYHLLTGNRSLQTVQDAHLFGLDKYYGVLPSLSRQAYDEYINYLNNKGKVQLLERDSTTYIKLLLSNQDLLNNKQTDLIGLNGLLFYKVDEIFYKRLLLYIQVLTNHFNAHTTYIPIISDKDILKWMKWQYNRVKFDINHYLEKLYKDLFVLLQDIPNQDAEMFVDRLTSFKQYGLSLQQLSMKYDQSITDVRLRLKTIIHRMLKTIMDKKNKTELLIHFLPDLPSFNILTESARKTYHLLSKQYSVSQISQIRRLKENTIKDHIVEICWSDQNYPIEQFVDEKTIQKVKQAIQTSNSLQLKTIKSLIPEEITYFQIQIALTRIKNVFAGSVKAYETNK